MAGALILCNLSASNITIGKARDRRLLSAAQSARCLAAYAYSAAGMGESTTDLAWDGQAMVHEMGELLVESTRFGDQPEIVYADVDVQRLRLERMRNGTFHDNAAAAAYPKGGFAASASAAAVRCGMTGSSAMCGAFLRARRSAATGCRLL